VGATAVSARAYQRIAVISLILLALIILSGAIVRLSGSGLGCSSWPNCNELHPIALSSTHQRVEQLNRLFSGLIGIPLVLGLLGAYRMQPRRRELVRYSWILVVLFLGEAVIGGIAVLVKLAWVSVMSHFLLAIALIAVAMLNIHAAYRTPGADHGRAALPARTTLLARATWFGIMAAIVIGTLVTAAGPHGGDKDVKRLAWPLPDVARTHGIVVDATLAAVVLLFVLVRRARGPLRVQRAIGALIVAMSVQAAIGYVQWWNEIPVVLVAFHVAGATLVFIAATELQLTIAPLG
jgi:cytochrome c oxidase assembly protein subunit 15